MHLVILTPSPSPAGGGQSFNAGLLPALRAAGHSIDVRHDAETLPEGAVPVVDGMLLPSLEPALDTLLARGAVAVIHHLAASAGRDAGRREAVAASEARMLPAFRRVIATSEPVADRLREQFGVAEPRIIQPGLPDLPRTMQAAAPPCRILAVGVLTPRKGHHRLLRALSRLIDLDWTLTIAGDAMRDQAHARSVIALAEELGLSPRLTMLANPSADTLSHAWATADLFALPTEWEGYPSGIAEALRRGIPILSSDLPSLQAFVPPGAGILANPNDPATLSKCLRRAIFDVSLRHALAEGAWQAGLALPSWPQQALAFIDHLRS